MIRLHADQPQCHLFNYISGSNLHHPTSFSDFERNSFIQGYSIMIQTK